MIKLLILKGVPEDKRSLMWLLCSGAKREMHNNIGYYESLSKNYPENIKLSSYNQIDKVK